MILSTYGQCKIPNKILKIFFKNVCLKSMVGILHLHHISVLTSHVSSAAMLISSVPIDSCWTM